MSKTKEEILKRHYAEYMEGKPIGFVPQLDEIYESAADEYAEQQSIEFFKWYASKMHGFFIYIQDIRPQVTSHEIEEKIAEFEGKPFATLYQLFLNDQNK
jgi:hypothetical protein